MARLVIALLACSLLPGCLATVGGSGEPYISAPILHDDGWPRRSSASPPGWYGSPLGWYAAPGGSWGDTQRRYVRAAPEVTCDRRTELCYKRGHIDTSETRDIFGRRAARDADALRDRLGTSHVYVPRPRGDSYCLSAEKTCFKNGRPDWSDTRDVYGKKTARKLRR